MGRLDTMDSRSQTWTHSFLLLFIQDTRVRLILNSGMLNQLQNWILRELVLLWVPVVPTLTTRTTSGISIFFNYFFYLAFIMTFWLTTCHSWSCIKSIRFLLSKNIFINITFANHAFLVHLQIRIMCYVSTLDACLVRNEMFFIIVINIIL